MPSTNSINPSEWASVAAGLLLCWSLCTWAARTWIRLRVLSPWGLDDSVITITQILATIQSALVMAAASSGFNQEPTLPRALQTLYTSQLFYILASSACKCAGALLVMRLTKHTGHLEACSAVIWTTFAWGTASLLLIALRGDLHQPWLTTNGTAALYHRWLAIEVVGIVLEVVLFGVCVFLMWALQVTKIVKTVILCAFGCRLLVIPAIALRLCYLRPETAVSTRNDHVVIVEVLTQIAMHYCIIAASVPCLKPFMRPFDSDWLEESNDTEDSSWRSRSRGNGYLHYVPSHMSKGRNVSITLSSVASGSRSQKAHTKLAPIDRVLRSFTRSVDNPQSISSMSRASRGSSDGGLLVTSSNMRGADEIELATVRPTSLVSEDLASRP